MDGRKILVWEHTSVKMPAPPAAAAASDVERDILGFKLYAQSPDKMHRCTREQEGAAGNFDSQPVITARARQPASQPASEASASLLFPATP